MIVLCALLGLALGPSLAGLSRVLADRAATTADVLVDYRRPGARGLLCGAITAALFALAARTWGTHLNLLPHLLLAAVCVLFSVIDLERYLIPNRLLVPTLYLSGGLMAVASFADANPLALARALAGALLFFAIMLGFHLLNPGGLGLGDVKLAFLLGLFLGWAGSSIGLSLKLTLYGLFFGSLIGSVFGVAKLVVSRKLGSHFPYGPSLCAGTLVTLVGAAGLAG